MIEVDEATKEFRLDPAVLRPGTVELRRATFHQPKVRALVDLIESYQLHRFDLEAAHAAAQHLADPDWPHGVEGVAHVHLRTVSVHGAVTTYFRCFDSKRRTCLRDEKVFRGASAAPGLVLHRHWKGMRDGHVAHDSNPWRQPRVLVEVGAGGRALGTYLLAMVGKIDTPEHVAGLGQIVEHTLNWVIAECLRAMDELHEVVTGLEAAEIARLPRPTFAAPLAGAAAATR